MKIFTTKQIAEIDKYTIENEPIKSIDLMERAARNLFLYLDSDYAWYSGYSNIVFVCGPGNNGGDGLALARLLLDEFEDRNIKIFLFAEKDKLSDDCKKNWKRLKKFKNIDKKLTCNSDDVEVNSNDLVIDALFGSGLTRSLGEPYRSLVNRINNSGAKIISIDIPSGLMGEDNRSNDYDSIVQADEILTLEFPKLSFFFPENEKFVKNFHIVPIFLHEKAKESIESPYYYIDDYFASSLLKTRKKFAEKRDFGHALLVAGSYEKPGAAILSSKACLRSGVGLIHVHIPKSCVVPISASLPEVMISIDENNEYTTNVPVEPYYSAVGIGPGIGTRIETVKAFEKLISELKEKNIPLIIDADGLNILSQNKYMFDYLPHNTILTPHNREFDRLFGNHNSHYERFLTAHEMSVKHKVIIVLKGAYTQIHTPDGKTYFNSSGTPAMAKAGSGDVLTGMILAFLAQNYSLEHSAILGAYYHGRAAENAEDIKGSQHTVIATDIIENIKF